MNIYISGISGTGMGPLALMAKDAGHNVYGSDLEEGPVARELRQHGIDFRIGPQDGSYLQELQEQTRIDWFVHTAALPKDHTELKLADLYGIRISKRDQLISFLVSQLNLKMVAIAGTHGKTTTTAMLIWAARRLRLPASYSVGTTLSYAPSGQYTSGDEFFIYEADEYDRNFLYFHPWLSVITNVSYDHPDIYATPEDYKAAFTQFESQSQKVIHGGKIDSRFSLSGSLRREDATSALQALKEMVEASGLNISEERIIEVLNEFPGAGRRFERIRFGFYSDYAHHPEEISETIKMAKEEAAKLEMQGVVVVYQPHQNTRQHQVRAGYKTAFDGVDKLFWLPTFLTREDTSLAVIEPKDFVSELELSGVAPDDTPIAEAAEMDDFLADKLNFFRAEDYLILLLAAGPADGWFRQNFAHK
jgi:UDP-N-acetylmuramate--alanine ligase